MFSPNVKFTCYSFDAFIHLILGPACSLYEFAANHARVAYGICRVCFQFAAGPSFAACSMSPLRPWRAWPVSLVFFLAQDSEALRYS